MGTKKEGKSPILIKYYSTSYESNKVDYLLREEGGKAYLCSEHTYYLANKLRKLEELVSVNSHSLPVEYCRYTPIKNKGYRISPIIAENEHILLKIANENFDYISWIGTFLEYLTPGACEKNLKKQLTLSYVTTMNYIPQKLMEQLIHIALKQYQELFNHERLALLLDPHIGEFVSTFETKY